MKRLLRSFKFAFRGIGMLVRTQANARIHLIITILVLLTGLLLRLSSHEWAILMVAAGMVWSAEGMNTAIEALADRVQPEHDERIAFVKDVAAGGVLLAALFAVLTGGFVFIPKIVVLF